MEKRPHGVRRVMAFVAAAGLTASPVAAQLPPDETVRSFTVADGLEAAVWAAEPDLVNPTSIDIDARGRVWVAEAANYRTFRTRPEGDRIVILEDTDGDGRCDSAKTFVQDPALYAPLGICVAGDKVFVAQSPNLLVYTIDASGDRPAGPPAALLTGFSGENSDHGLHAGVVGPDGRYVFNVGNSGLRSALVKNAAGEPVVDSTGSQIGARAAVYRKAPKEKGQIGYQEGMAFRCALDGTEMETLGHNFRNPYEIAVDSFGTAWQSDNDDDGNEACRINYVMEGGDFGYKGPKGTAWAREMGLYPGQTRQEAHWHQRMPGVVPNVLHTGAGAPGGMCVYEGALLPDKYRGAILHGDTGPNVVRAYLPRPSGAGYAADSVELVKAKDRWFRPIDVCVAPDGAVFIADWYDPVVGNNNMGDPPAPTLRGRIYRLAPKGHKPAVPYLDFGSVEGQVAALCSPAMAARYRAYAKLTAGGEAAARALRDLYATAKDPRPRARALWALARLPGGEAAAREALKDPDADVRVAAVRAARRLRMDLVTLAGAMTRDPSPSVWRELCLALAHEPSERCLDALVALADRYDGRDRWYLEAFGIAAAGREAQVLEVWRKRGANRDPKTAEGLAWRLLRSLPESPLLKDRRPLPSMDALLAIAGDAQAGAAVFRNAQGANCIGCHEIGKEGRLVGPPLTAIGEKLTKAQIVEAILNPSASIPMGYEQWVVRTQAGTVETGLLVEETGDHVTLKDAKGEFHDIPTADIEEKSPLTTSLMPDGLVQMMSLQELVDVVEFLSRQKGAPEGRR